MKGRSASMYTAPEAAAPIGAVMQGRTCLVTGGNRGLGKATALGLAQRGARLVLLARDERRLSAAADEIRQRVAGADVSIIVVDLGSLASVQRAADEILRRVDAIHVLVNNAGVNLARRAVSPDGIEMTFAVNHVGPFALTNRLRPLLEAGAPSRVVTVTSWFERLGRIDFDDVQGVRKRYRPLSAYYRSKLANALFAYELAERLTGTGVTSNCVDPGLVATDLLRDRLWWSPRWLQPLWRLLLKTPQQGAAGAIRAAADPALVAVSGTCVTARGTKRTSRRSRDVELRKRLWIATAELTAR